MKFLFAPLVLGISGVLLAAQPVSAQLPFSSTAPPSPFNRFNTSSSPLQSNSAAQQGQYPQASAVPGSAMQATALNGTGAVDPSHRLTRGDQLTYHVAEDRDDKVVPLMVQDSGDVIVPYIGPVKAVGKTTSELGGDIKSRLESEYYYHASVTLGLSQAALHSNGRVWVTGELAGHGALDLPADGQLSVSQAILQMGGGTEDSDLKHVRIVRKGVGKKGFIEVNVAAVLKGESDKDMMLQSGDTVVVKKNLFGIKF